MTGLASVFRFSNQRWWPRGGGADLYRVEQVLATARVVLGIVLVVSLTLTPGESSAIVSPGVPVPILLFLAYSLLLLAVIRIRGRMSPMLGVGMHAFDLTWAALGTSMADISLAPFSIFNLFALVAAAYRWGLWETLATAAAVALLVLFQTTVAGSFVVGPSFIDAMVGGGVGFWLVNLGMLAWLVGYLGEQEKVLRYEASSAASLMASVQGERGLRGSLRAAAAEMLRIFSAREILVVSSEMTTGRLFLNRATRSEVGGDVEHTGIEVPGDVRGRYLLAHPPAWSVVVRSTGTAEEHLDTLAIDSEGHRLQERVVLPPSFREAHTFRTILGVSFKFGEEWTGAIFLLDVPDGATKLRALTFLRTLVRDAGPALYGLYLLRRLRDQVGAAERARVARELHDGVIQSLLGIELRLDVLKRQANKAPRAVESEVAELQHLVHEEVLSLRDLLQHMRPPDPGSNLASHLSDMADRFRRDTGIAVNLVADMNMAPFGSGTRRQIVRIVQEALVNIRKHSGARNVIIRMQLDADLCRLTIDDDGRGYDFSGRRTMDQLDAARRGPVVIKERVRDMRGTIAIESVPGRGSRLDIVLPRRL